MKPIEKYLEPLYITNDGEEADDSDESVHDTVYRVLEVLKQVHEDTKELYSTKEVTRVEVIDKQGRSYVNWNKENEVTIDFQDDGKTLKVFITKKAKNMNNYYNVTYVPHHKHDKEWIAAEASSKSQLQKDFKGGMIISIREISKDEFMESQEDY